MVGEENAHQFARAAVAGQPDADVGEHGSTAKISQHPGGAAIFLVNGIFIGDCPDILAEVLQAAELNMRRVLCKDFDHAIQQRVLIAIEGRVVLLNEAHVALFLSDNQGMREGG